MKFNSDILLARIREGGQLGTHDKVRLIAALSAPSIMAQLSSVLMFFIDAAMVGHLGARASASIGLVESTTWLFGGLLGVASTGFSVLAAHAIGANDFQRARAVFRLGLVCTLISSTALTVFAVAVHRVLPFWLGGGADIAADASAYFVIFGLILPVFQWGNLCGAMLKSAGKMRLVGTVNVLMCVLDVVFNYVFIYIFNLGVPGAAYGTALATAICSYLQFHNAVFRSEILSLRRAGEGFVWVAAYVRDALKIAGPLALQSVLMGGAQIVSTLIVAPLGNFAIAANTFAITVESLCYMPGYGIGDAAATLVGQSVGAGRRALCRSFARMTVGGGMLVMTVMGVVMFAFAPEMMSLLSPVPEIVGAGTTALRIEAFAEPMFAASIVTYSVCVGAGDTLVPSLINLGSMWLVRLTLAVCLAATYGLPGVWTAMAVELCLRGALFLWRLRSEKWLRKVHAQA